MSITSDRPYLSVVIPAYNEAINFKSGVLTPALAYLKNQTYSWEIIFIDDGSTDDTYTLLSKIASKDKHIKVLHISHGGKAAAVTAGVMFALGEYILFTDFDQSTPLSQVDKFLSAHTKGADVVTAWRTKTSKDTLVRKTRSWIYVTLVQLVALPTIKDSQCGFKSFTHSAARQIFSGLKVSRTNKVSGGYMGAWDVEVLFLAIKYGFTIAQEPVEWIKYSSNRLNIWTEPLKMFLDTFTIRLYDILGKYNEKNPELKKFITQNN